MNISTNFVNDTGIENLANPFVPCRRTESLSDYVKNLFDILGQYSSDIKHEVQVSIDGDLADINVRMYKNA